MLSSSLSVFKKIKKNSYAFHTSNYITKIKVLVLNYSDIDYINATLGLVPLELFTFETLNFEKEKVHGFD